MAVPVLLIAGLVAGANAAGSAAANASDAQGPRIRELKQARSRGLLTASGQADVEQGYDQARRMQTGAEEQTARQLAAMGGTSGADVKALREASDKGTAALYSQLGERVQQERQGEAMELASRQHLRRQRLLGTISGAAKAGVSAGTMAAQAKAYEQGKPKAAETPDVAGVAKVNKDVGSAFDALVNTPEFKRLTQEQQDAEIRAILAHSESP